MHYATKAHDHRVLMKQCVFLGWTRVSSWRLDFVTWNPMWQPYERVKHLFLYIDLCLTISRYLKWRVCELMFFRLNWKVDVLHIYHKPATALFH